MRKLKKNPWDDPIYRAMMCAERKARFDNPEYLTKFQKAHRTAKSRKKRSESHIVVWAENKEYRKSQLKLRKGKAYRQKMADARNKNWANLQYIQRQAEARPAANAKRSLVKWTPERRKRMQTLYNSVEWRKQQAIGAKESYAVMSQVNKDTANKKRSTTLRQGYISGRIELTRNGNPHWKVGHIKTNKAGDVYCRSSWERTFFQILDSSSLVKDFKSEPFVIPYVFQGKKRAYHPDCWLQVAGGLEFVVELKGWGEDLPINKAKFKAAKKWCDARDIEFVVMAGEAFNDWLRTADPVATLLQ